MRADPTKPPADLMALVAADLKPVRPVGSSSRRLTLWLPLALALFLGFPLYAGLRADAPALGPIVTWAASLAQVTLGVWLLWAGARESRPGRRLPTRLVVAVMALAAAFVLVLTVLTFAISPTTLSSTPRLAVATTFCFGASVAVGAPFLFLAGWLLGRGLPGQPWLAGALFGAGAGLTVDASWRLVCPIADPRHVLMGHGSALLVLTVVGSAAASLAARHRIGATSRS